MARTTVAADTPVTKPGKLKVYLGAAPGAGKTYRMLDEGRRRARRGTGVVVGFVECHKRPYTLEMLDSLKTVPRIRRRYRDSEFEEMVLVSGSSLADRVEIRVIDHGPGLQPDDHDRNFEPFQRMGDNDNTTGPGLGLALSRGLAQAMDGTLTPEDTPGGGLSMVLSLPAAPVRLGKARTP
ncbi:ATP-binding protein [Streptomyces humicola]|uniref:ATP-binding protein n=1 Tax=Streptomyces humicola TaxID=2953240 RepID=UPI00210E0391|nr:ATP-binding protein [Streptomyces humicola]